MQKTTPFLCLFLQWNSQHLEIHGKKDTGLFIAVFSEQKKGGWYENT